MKIVCIGAGASGLFFSIHASSFGHEVILLESNAKVGRKIAITGKGRCNITNNCSATEFINNVVTNPKFLYSAINGFTPSDTIEWFNNHGCPLKTERGNRVFPVSDKSFDIIDTLLREAKRAGTKIIYNEKVEDIYQSDSGFVIKTNNRKYDADNVVIATGGLSYHLTGSTGDGYRFAKKLSHTVIEPKSALCPIKIKEKIDKSMLDFTLKNVSLTASNESFNKSIFGDLEFLSHAITGPIAISMSSFINKVGDVNLSLDFKPALDEEKLDNRILRDIKDKPNENVSYLLRGLLPREIIPFFVINTKTDVETVLNSFTKEDRLKLVRDLKHFHFSFDGLDDIDKGIVTCGGVSVKEVNQQSMESKIIPGLYFIGEVLDVDALTGGFNLQIALSTAYAAASHI